MADEKSTAGSPPSRFRRRWFRFSLRTLLVIVTIFALWLGFAVHAAKRQRDAVTVLNIGPGVTYDYDYSDEGSSPYHNRRPPWPAWLINAAGVDFFHAVHEVSSRHITDSDPTKCDLTALRHLPELRRVELGGMSVRLSEADLEGLASLKKLEWLNLSDDSLRGEDLRHFRDLPKLKILLLWRNQIDDAGLQHLTALRNLEVLVLEGNKITDDGLQWLSGLTSLHQLDLSGNPVTDAGLEHVKRMSGLTRLNVAGTAVSTKGIKRLQQARPELSIYSSFGGTSF